MWGGGGGEWKFSVESAQWLFSPHPRRPRGSQSEAGEMARRKFSRTGGRTPGYQVSPDHFQTALRIPAPDWAEKIPCIILPNRRAATLESLSAIVVLPYLSGSCTKIMHTVRESFSLITPCISKCCLHRKLTNRKVSKDELKKL